MVKIKLLCLGGSPCAGPEPECLWGSGRRAPIQALTAWQLGTSDTCVSLPVSPPGPQQDPRFPQTCVGKDSILLQLASKHSFENTHSISII